MQDLLTARQSAVNRSGNDRISKPRARGVKLETAIHQAAPLIGFFLELGAARVNRSD
jgi:hypothetical protein